MNEGPAIKANAKSVILQCFFCSTDCLQIDAHSQRYATTTETDFLLKQVAAKVGVPLQEYGVRNDMRQCFSFLTCSSSPTLTYKQISLQLAARLLVRPFQFMHRGVSAADILLQMSQVPFRAFTVSALSISAGACNRVILSCEAKLTSIHSAQLSMHSVGSTLRSQSTASDPPIFLRPHRSAKQLAQRTSVTF